MEGNMKKLFLFLIFFSIFVFVGCGNGSTNNKPDNSTDHQNDEDIISAEAENNDPDNNDDVDTELTDDDLDNTNDETDPELTDDDDKITGNPDSEYVAENCEIDDSYTESNFGEYFTLKSIFVINDFNGTRDTTAKLYLENSDYSFESDYVYDMSDARRSETIIFFHTDLYNNSVGSSSHLIPYLLVLTKITDTQISSGTKEENGRINLESAPEISVHTDEYHEEYYSEKAWLKRCLVATNKNSPTGFNGRVQLCPGNKGTFDSQERIKAGIDVELTSKEEDLIEFVNRGISSDDPNYARSGEDLCTKSCVWSGAIMNTEKSFCECPAGTYFTNDWVDWSTYSCKEY